MNISESDIEVALRNIFFYDDYAVYETDLTSAHDNHLIDFERDLGFKVTKLVVLRADDTAYIKINRVSNQNIEAVPNLTIEHMPISRIYITNTASGVSGAKLVILVFWKVR